MAVSRAQKHQRLNSLRTPDSVLDTLRHQQRQCWWTSSPGYEGRHRQLQPGDLVRKFDAELLRQDPRLSATLSDAVNEVRDFDYLNLGRTMSCRTPARRQRKPISSAAMGAVELMPVDDETIAQVVDELERDYLLSLPRSSLLAGERDHRPKLAELGTRQPGQLPRYRELPPGVRRRSRPASMVTSTMSPASATYLFGEGLRTLDEEPQFHADSQWFTYKDALWEEQYRIRLATAHGTDEDGNPWTRFDITRPIIWRYSKCPQRRRSQTRHRRGQRRQHPAHLVHRRAPDRTSTAADDVARHVVSPDKTLETPTPARPGNPTAFPRRRHPACRRSSAARQRIVLRERKRKRSQ